MTILTLISQRIYNSMLKLALSKLKLDGQLELMDRKLKRMTLLILSKKLVPQEGLTMRLKLLIL